MARRIIRRDPISAEVNAQPRVPEDRVLANQVVDITRTAHAYAIAAVVGDDVCTRTVHHRRQLASGLTGAIGHGSPRPARELFLRGDRLNSRTSIAVGLRPGRARNSDSDHVTRCGGVDFDAMAGISQRSRAVDSDANEIPLSRPADATPPAISARPANRSAPARRAFGR